MDPYEQKGWTKVGQFKTTPVTDTAPTFVPLTRPVYTNTKQFPDENVRGLLKENNIDMMILTLEECIYVLADLAWSGLKDGWQYVKETTVGTVVVNYGQT